MYPSSSSLDCAGVSGDEHGATVYSVSSGCPQEQPTLRETYADILPRDEPSHYITSIGNKVLNWIVVLLNNPLLLAGG